MFSNITTAQGFEIMGVVLLFVLAFLADTYTTMIGLQHGMTEGNPVSRWLFKKIGQSLTVFLEAGAILWLGAFMTNYGAHAAELFFGIPAVGESIIAIRNYSKLKAMKISLK